MALEDDFSDILKKARAGRRQSVKDLSGTSGVPESEIADLERGHALCVGRQDQFHLELVGKVELPGHAHDQVKTRARFDSRVRIVDAERGDLLGHDRHGDRCGRHQHVDRLGLRINRVGRETADDDVVGARGDVRRHREDQLTFILAGGQIDRAEVDEPLALKSRHNRK